MHGSGRRSAAWALAVIMALGAALHAHWALGGMWLLADLMNAPPGDIPPDTVSGPVRVVTWMFAGGMLLAALLGLCRAYWTDRRLLRRLCSAGLWVFSPCMLAGAVFNVLGARDLGRFVLAPVFLVTAGLAAYLALPHRPGRGRPAAREAARRKTGPAATRRLRIAAVVIACLVAAAGLFRYVYLPWNLGWGATEEEFHRRMAGDELCRDANFSPTRAITIEASPEEVWPWIVQMGYQRGGFYSYDSLDNGGVPSAERIRPEFQDVRIGDRIPLDRSGAVFVRALEPNRLLVLATEPAFLTWVWELHAAGPGRTRLVTRVRARMGDAQMKFVWDTFEFFMMRKCLLGIKRRAESAGRMPLDGCRSSSDGGSK